jgi:hypothetical protein
MLSNPDAGGWFRKLGGYLDFRNSPYAASFAQLARRECGPERTFVTLFKLYFEVGYLLAKFRNLFSQR